MIWHMEILFENCLIPFLILVAPTQRRECDIVKGCRVSKIIQCATVNCPRQSLEIKSAGVFAKLATRATFISV